MTPMLLAVAALTALLAAANGSNDSGKGVATLAGAGVTRYRTALAWGVAATLLGSLLSLTFAARISTLFSKGIVDAPLDAGFSLAVLVGTMFWVSTATMIRLPVSTTHALVGALIGAGLLLGPGAVRWSSLLLKVGTPLLLSIAVSYGLSAWLVQLARRAQQRELRPLHGHATAQTGLGVDLAHWLTSGATSFARGLNDTPKIWAVGAFALVPRQFEPASLLVLIALAMAIGGLLGGVRVAHRLGGGVVAITHEDGFTANLTTTVLVGAGANLGLPMSTTHVATGSIAGIAGRHLALLNGRAMRDFALAWTVTPAVAGLMAGAVYSLVR